MLLLGRGSNGGSGKHTGGTEERGKGKSRKLVSHLLPKTKKRKRGERGGGMKSKACLEGGAADYEEGKDGGWGEENAQKLSYIAVGEKRPTKRKGS